LTSDRTENPLSLTSDTLLGLELRYSPVKLILARNLLYLQLFGCPLENEMLSEILFQCNNLEGLTFIGCYKLNLDNLILVSPKLKILQFSITVEKEYCSKSFQFLKKKKLNNLTTVRVFQDASLVQKNHSLFQLAQVEISIRLKEEFPRLLRLQLPDIGICSPTFSGLNLEESTSFNSNPASARELQDWIWKRTVNFRTYKEKVLVNFKGLIKRNIFRECKYSQSI
jgi:hypothetical protein